MNYLSKIKSLPAILLLFATLGCGTTRKIQEHVVPFLDTLVSTTIEQIDASPLSILHQPTVVHLPYHNNTAAAATPSTWQQQLQQRLDTLCNQPLFSYTRLALCVYDLTEDAMLYSVNAEQRMRPASNMKLVTAITALDLLGPDHVYTPVVKSPGWGWCWDDEETGITDFGFKGKRKAPDMLYAESKPRRLGDILIPMMKQSDNMLAESMFWQLPDTAVAEPTRKDCAAPVQALIQRLGLEPSLYTIADGSGVSLYNYLSAQLLLRLLQHAYHTSPIYAALYPSLPIAGVDGTLRNRMKDTPAQGNVHAKTGTVTGVSSLSGYCTHPSGHQLCFSIINQGIPSSSLGRNFQDQVCETLTTR